MVEERESKVQAWAAPFFTIWGGQAASLLGSALVQFGLVWWLTQTTGSATVLATATLVAMLPAVFIGPLAGVLVDRWDRRIVMIVADGLIALATLGLAYLFAVGAAQVWHIYLIMFFRALGGGFHWPAMEASTSLMVPEEHLSRVAGLNQTLNGILNIVAPPVGALLLSVLPMQGILAIDVGTAVLAITPLFFIPIPQPERRGEAGAFSLVKDLREGLQYVWGWPGLMGLLIMATVLNFLLTPAFSLMPILVTEHFGGEAIHLGWLDSAFGVGVVAGGLILSAWGGFRRRMVTSLTGIIGIGIGTLLIGLTPATAFWFALIGSIFVGLMQPIANGPLMAIIQARVEPEMQGRVFTLLRSVATAMSPLGMAIAGPVADWLGVRTWYWVGGAACVLMGVGAFFTPAILYLEDNHRKRESRETGSRVGDVGYEVQGAGGRE
ncbi:MAG TPA: MFS transporter [Thermoflexia bacterium]|nr:MFS transporter [Thermoflexia bacterium]